MFVDLTNQGTLAMIVGCCAVAYGVFCLIRMISSRNWTAAEGRIISSTKAIVDSDAGKLQEANIRYEYTVDGKMHRSSVVKSGGDVSSPHSKSSETDVDRLLAKYPVGAAVTVYFHPSMPSVACLERGGGEAIFICLIFGPLAIVVGYYFL
jgi:hypothetical protein